jgi:hypothetical protein
MTHHTCELCLRVFQQKSHLDDHLFKKKECGIPENTIIQKLDPPIISSHDLDDQRELLALQYKQKRNAKIRESSDISYPNQKEAAMKCLEHFNNGKMMVLLVAQPGTGKTGTAHEVMYNMGIHNDNPIHASQMVICSGMSDCQWKQQFERNVIDGLSKNVFHRGNMMRNKDRLKFARLVVDDECHVASGHDMVVSTVFRDAGLLDISSLETRSAKILEISATPEAVSHDLKKWGDKAAIVKLEPGPDYKGFQVMLDEKRIIKAPVLYSLESTLELLKKFDTRFANTSKKYFIFRVSPKIARFIEEASRLLKWAPPIYHNSEERVYDIDKLMENAPEKHVAICVKGFWRASKRLIRTNVGGSYEAIPKGKRNTTATSQGLTARFCDTYKYSGDMLNPDLRPLHFCDIEAVKEYLKCIESEFDYNKTAYTCSKLTSNGRGNVQATRTKIHPSNIDGLEVPEEPEVLLEFEKGYRIFDTKDEAEEFAKGLGAQRRTTYDKDENGFELCSSSSKRVHSKQELIEFLTKSRPCSNMDKKPSEVELNKHAFRRYVCYDNLQDTSSVKYIVAWAKRIRNPPTP